MSNCLVKKYTNISNLDIHKPDTFILRRRNEIYKCINSIIPQLVRLKIVFNFLLVYFSYLLETMCIIVQNKQYL